MNRAGPFLVLVMVAAVLAVVAGIANVASGHPTSQCSTDPVAYCGAK